ncbi:MAG: hypothetical protein HPY61_08520 [Methanotrichaceae archaeon]|nr:hypothetical protein [Methanotrichaceae archaeon]
MKNLKLMALLCLTVAASAVSLAAGETLDLGDARISLDLDGLGSYNVEVGSPTSLDHDYDPRNSDFQYTIFPASITFDGASGQIQIEVHQMSTSQPLDTPISDKDTSTGLEHCISEADMMPRRSQVQMEPYSIDGQDGTLATVGQGDDQMYIVAYSPDQNGGSGATVCVIGSDLPWEATEKIFDSVEVQKA